MILTTCFLTELHPYSDNYIVIYRYCDRITPYSSTIGDASLSTTTAPLLTLFARREPTTDSFALSHGLKGKRDVVYYRDREATEFAARIPWHYSNKPTKASKTCILNCYRWQLEWLEDLG